MDPTRGMGKFPVITGRKPDPPIARRLLSLIVCAWQLLDILRQMGDKKK